MPSRFLTMATSTQTATAYQFRVVTAFTDVPKKRFDAPMLIDPFKKSFVLPAGFVQLANGGRRRAEQVGIGLSDLSRSKCRYRHFAAERIIPGPVIGRRLSFGSDSVTGADLAALMYSTVATLTLNGIDVLRWLKAWLGACAHNGGRPPEDLASWLPWSMEPARRREPAAPT